MLKKVLVPSVLLLFCACGTYNHEEPKAAVPLAAAFSLLSDDFTDKNLLSPVFTCDGANISPALKWSGAPAGTRSFALTLRDPDAPSGDFLHWAVVDIPAGSSGTARNVKFPPGSRELKNDAGGFGYTGPCPPSGTHRYIFTLYSLDTERFGDDPAALEDFFLKHAVAKTVLTGLYERK